MKALAEIQQPASRVALRRGEGGEHERVDAELADAVLDHAGWPGPKIRNPVRVRI